MAIKIIRGWRNTYGAGSTRAPAKLQQCIDEALSTGCYDTEREVIDHIRWGRSIYLKHSVYTFICIGDPFGRDKLYLKQERQATKAAAQMTI